MYFSDQQHNVIHPTTPPPPKKNPPMFIKGKHLFFFSRRISVSPHNSSRQSECTEIRRDSVIPSTTAATRVNFSTSRADSLHGPRLDFANSRADSLHGPRLDFANSRADSLHGPRLDFARGSTNGGEAARPSEIRSQPVL